MTGTILILIALLLAVIGFGWAISRIQKEEAVRSRSVLRYVASLGLAAALVFLFIRLDRLGGSGSLIADFFVVLVMVGTIALCAILLGVLWAPYLSSWVASPLVSLFDGGTQEIERQPLYSVAQALSKRGRYDEAIGQIQRQLSQFPGDFTGTLLLAEVQLQRHGDFVGAIQTLETWITEWGSQSNRLPAALNQIAEWHLQGRQDPNAARAALERVLKLFPDSEAAHLARQRIAHLASAETLADRAHPHRVQLGEYASNVGLMLEPIKPKPPKDPVVLAAECLHQLDHYPDDNETRERLARIYADDLKQIIPARQHLEWLLAQPKAPEREVVRWLNLLTHFELHCAGDLESARAALGRIIERFPRSAAAEQARQRTSLLALELRGKQKSQTLRLGSSDKSEP